MYINKQEITRKNELLIKLKGRGKEYQNISKETIGGNE